MVLYGSLLIGLCQNCAKMRYLKAKTLVAVRLVVFILCHLLCPDISNLLLFLTSQYLSPFQGSHLCVSSKTFFIVLCWFILVCVVPYWTNYAKIVPEILFLEYFNTIPFICIYFCTNFSCFFTTRGCMRFQYLFFMYTFFIFF